MLGKLIILAVSMVALSIMPARGQQKDLPAGSDTLGAAANDTSQSQIAKVGDHTYKLGSLTIDSELREITIPGKVNMHKGMIELLACGPGGKTHESVLVLDVAPYHLQVALLLLGLQYVGGLAYQGDPHTPRGDSVEVWVKWKNGDRDTSVRGEDLVWDIPRNRHMEHTPWVFVGSIMSDGKFMADVEKSLITTYHDPLTILDNPLTTGGDDTLYRVNEDLVPAKGTPVEVRIKALSKEK